MGEMEHREKRECSVDSSHCQRERMHKWRHWLFRGAGDTSLVVTQGKGYYSFWNSLLQKTLWERDCDCVASQQVHDSSSLRISPDSQHQQSEGYLQG